MKNYKMILPVALVVLYAFSIFFRYYNNNDLEKAYEGTLILAQDYEEKGLTTDALIYYQKAMELRPSLELNWRVIDMFVNSGEMDKAKVWADITLVAFPFDAKAYEWTFEQYYEDQRYSACYEVLDNAASYKIQSEYLDRMAEEILYTYYLNGSYDEVGDFSSGYCAVAQNGVWGYVNEQGKKVIDFQYLSAGIFHSDRAAVVTEEEGAFFIDTEGRKRNYAYGLDDTVALGTLVGQVFAVSNGNKWGYYKTDYTWLFGGYDYDYVTTFNDGVAAVRDGSQWTLIGSDGLPLTNEAYDDILMNIYGMAYCNGAFVKKNGQYSLVDKNGIPITEALFEDAKAFNDASYAAVQVNGMWGFIDDSGEMIIEAQYEDARSFSNGWAAVKLNGLWGFINSSGDITIEPAFVDVRDLNSSACVMVDNGSGWQLLRLYKYNH